MARVKLTDQMVARFKPQAQTDYWDELMPGLQLRATPGGDVKTWCVRYARGGKKYRMTLGRYPAIGLAVARSKARLALIDVQEGRDPQAPKFQDAPDFAKVLEEYRRLRLPALADTTRASWERLLNTEIAPKLKTLDPRDVRGSRRAIRDLLDGIEERGAPETARTVYTVIHRVVRWAVERDLVDVPALAIVDGLRKPERGEARTRTLRDAEVRLVWDAAVREPVPFPAYWKLLFWCGQRPREETLTATWSQFDLDTVGGETWTLRVKGRGRRRVGGEVTGGKEHVLPLPRQAADFLRALRQVTGGTPFLFPGAGADAPLRGVQKSLDRVRERSGVVDFRLHDVRRTAATNLARLGVEQRIISLIMSHSLKDSDAASITAQVYVKHGFLAEQRAALQLWANHIDNVTAKAGK